MGSFWCGLYDIIFVCSVMFHVLFNSLCIVLWKYLYIIYKGCSAFCKVTLYIASVRLQVIYQMPLLTNSVTLARATHNIYASIIILTAPDTNLIIHYEDDGKLGGWKKVLELLKFKHCRPKGSGNTMIQRYSPWSYQIQSY